MYVLSLLLFRLQPRRPQPRGGAGQQAEGLLVELALCTAALRLDFCVVFAVFDKRGRPEVGDAGVQTLGEENYGESHARGGADVGQ